MTTTDYEYYADPEHRVPAGPGRRRVSKALTTHVPIRFSPEVIGDVKQLADTDRKTVSSWIRDVVEAEVERRRPRYPESVGLPTAPVMHWTGVMTESESLTAVGVDPTNPASKTPSPRGVDYA
jgi:hypothetical protein